MLKSKCLLLCSTFYLLYLLGLSLKGEEGIFLISTLWICSLKKKRKYLFFFVFSLQLLPGMYYSKPFVTFHQINAFEDQGCVVIDLCCQDDGRSLEVYQLQNLRKVGEGLDQVNISDLSEVVNIILN